MNLLTKLRYVPKRFGVLTALFIAGTTAALTFAWGPDRPTFTMERPADHVTLNSITNNPNYGDEREFVMVRDLTAGGNYGDSTNLVPGHEYQVQIYVHNNAHSDLNASGKGIAKDTTVRAALPASVNGAETVDAFVKASNATPAEVWDSAAFTSNGKVDLEYVNGSGHLSTNYQQVALPDSLITTGVKVGDQDLSGNWRGCLAYAGIVTFKIKVKVPMTNTFTMDKQVRKHSTTTGGWVETYAAQPGETVDYIIRYANTGTYTQENVVIKDTLPAGMTYVAGSTILANGQYPNGTAANDGVTSANGLNIGSYAPGATAWVRFSAKVADNPNLPACGANTLHNVASVETGAGTKTDGADVTVNKECQPAPVCKYTCDSLTVTKVDRTHFKFETKYTVENAQYIKTVYIIRDASGKELYRGTEATYAQTIPGTYTVEAQVVVKVDGVEKTATGDNCKKTFTVEATPVVDKDITVCRLSDKKYPVTIKESEFDASKYSKNPDDCKVLPATDKDITVCRLSDKAYPVTIKESAFDSTKYSKNPEDCKVSVCRLSDKTVVKIYESEFDSAKYSRDTANCKPAIPVTTTPTPAAPAAIASTGPEMVFSGLLGSSALGLGISSFVRSRRALHTALNS